MLKDAIEFLVSYPLWVKITVVLLAAGIVLLLVAFRPAPKKDSETSRILKIDRIESEQAYTKIRLQIMANGKEYKFPENYEYATYEPNMEGGEYRLPDGDNYEITIRIKAQTEAIRPGENTPRTITKELQSRQPIRFSAQELPRQGDEAFRPVDFGAQGSPPGFNIRLTYSVKER